MKIRGLRIFGSGERMRPLLFRPRPVLMTFLRRIASDEDGSAVLEFVAIAIPLFIPMILYFGELNGRIQQNLTLQNLARQAARAFVTSPDENLAPVRAQAVLDAAQSTSTLMKGDQSIHIAIQCASVPCLKPDSKVKVTLTLEPSKRSASDIQVVDAWR